MTYPNQIPEKDRILDGLIDELLDRQTPRVPSVESLLGQHPNHTARFSPEEIEQALYAARRDRLLKNSSKPLTHSMSRSRSAWLAWTSLAAVLIGVSLVAWQNELLTTRQPNHPANVLTSNNKNTSITNDKTQHPRQNNRSNQASSSATSTEQELRNADLLSKDIRNNENQSKEAPSREDRSGKRMSDARSNEDNRVAGSQVEAGMTGENSKTTSTSDLAQNRPTDIPTSVLGGESDRSVIAVIDHQFEDMWSQFPEKLPSLPPAGQTNAVDRIAQYLLARPANPTELEALRQSSLLNGKNAAAKDANWIDAVSARWLSSEEFARHWAKRLSYFYLGEHPVEIDQLERAKAFELWLAGLIHKDTPLSSIQTEVLQGLWKQEHPARFLVDHWAELSAGSSSIAPAVEASSSSKVKYSAQTWVGLSERQYATLTGVTHLFLRVTDNANLACAQCHQQSGISAANSVSSIATESANDSQTTEDSNSRKKLYSGDQFVRSDKSAKPIALGSIAALLLGIVEPQRKELFTRDGEDRLVKLSPVNPEGTRIADSHYGMEAMAEWSERGSHSQRATINALWKSFFGVHLVRPAERFSTTQSTSRAELLEFLSQRSAAQNATVRQIAYWMLHSAPSRQPNVSLTANELLSLDTDSLRILASRLELQHLQISTVGSSRFSQQDHPTNPATSLERVVARIVPMPQELQQRALLAQPSVKNSTQTSIAPPLSQTQVPSMLELSVAAPPQELAQLESHWTQSTLNSSELIAHAYLTLRARLPGKFEQTAWEQSRLEQYDRADAIRRLLGIVSSFEYVDSTN